MFWRSISASGEKENMIGRPSIKKNREVPAANKMYASLKFLFF
jgi:hypothetical protein